MKKVRYELIMWFNGFLKLIPGNIGCSVRKFMLPVKAGKNVRIWDNVHIDSPSKLIIGNNVSINRGTIINAGGGISIGNDVLIGPNVVIYSQNHRFRDNKLKIVNQGYDLKEVVIGNNVWIAANVIILPGVSIGDNCVIAAGAIITKSVMSTTIVKNKLSSVLVKY
uniref:acyltransferase n=1 Tax=Flavobacterium sp. TaxID=239 RepID=UPI00404AC516